MPQRTKTRGAPVSVAVFEAYRGFVVGQRLYCGGPMSGRLAVLLLGQWRSQTRAARRRMVSDPDLEVVQEDEEADTDDRAQQSGDDHHHK